jgi:hypothetical protein
MASSFLEDLKRKKIIPEKKQWISETVDPTVKKYLEAD